MKTFEETIVNRLEEGTLIRKEWTGTDEQGRATACLLAAMAPVCGTERDASVCPAEIMPAWLAHLTPWMDDYGTLEAWPTMVRRYANLSSRWHVLDAPTWHRLDYAARRIVLENALSFAGESESIIKDVIHLCSLKETGATVSSEDWRSAQKAAKAVAKAAGATEAAAWAASWAAAKAAEAAAWAAQEAAGAAAWAAAKAKNTIGDKITAEILSAIEAKIIEAIINAKNKP